MQFHKSCNSRHKPFVLVGLETMVAGGVACMGHSGEDYVIPGHNVLVLETADQWEFVSLFRELRTTQRRSRLCAEPAGRRPSDMPGCISSS